MDFKTNRWKQKYLFEIDKNWRYDVCSFENLQCSTEKNSQSRVVAAVVRSSITKFKKLIGFRFCSFEFCRDSLISFILRNFFLFYRKSCFIFNGWYLSVWWTQPAIKWINIPFFMKCLMVMGSQITISKLARETHLSNKVCSYILF